MRYQILALIASRLGSLRTLILSGPTYSAQVLMQSPCKMGPCMTAMTAVGKFRYITILRGTNDAYKSIPADVSAISADATTAADEQYMKFRKRA